MIRPFFLIIILFSYPFLLIQAKEISGTHQFTDWEKAKESKSRLQFIVESTKAGLFSSDVDGYVKSFSYSAQFDENNYILRDMKITFKVQNMDTDNESRDNKLHNLCLAATQFPSIEVNVPGPLFLKDVRKRQYDGIVKIRGKEKKFKITLNQKLEDEKLFLEGKTRWGLNEMEIPDPSIFIAKLSDEIRINIRLEEKIQ